MRTMLEERVKIFEGRFMERHVKALLEIIVLAMLNGKPMHGYKIIAAIHREFGFLLSPGSLYPLLHILKRRELIESNSDGGKKSLLDNT